MSSLHPESVPPLQVIKKTGQAILTGLLHFGLILGEIVQGVHTPLPIVMKTGDNQKGLEDIDGHQILQLELK